MTPKVSIIILNWNAADETIKSVEACRQIAYENFDIVVVDNHSSEVSPDKIEQACPDSVLIRNSENLGYAGGNNAGIRYALESGADYVFILNNDAVPEKDMIGKLVSAYAANAKAGIAAPKVLLHNAPDSINSLGTDMNWLYLRPFVSQFRKKDIYHRGEILKPKILLGCALFLSRKVIEDIGFLDERFFLIHEDADWCLRSLKAGYENIVVTDAVVYHKLSLTLGKYPLMSYYYSIRNFLYMAKKNASLPQKVLTCLGVVLYGLKSLAVMPFSSARKRSRVFGWAVSDFVFNRMGISTRSFD